MGNYMKSELYRIFHARTIYFLTAVLAVLAVFVNVVLYLFRVNTTRFPYGSVRFSFSNLITGMQIFYIGAMLVVMLLSVDEYKNGILKNAIAGGLSRTHIFVGKCIVYSITAMGSAAVILAAYISTAYGLLEYDPAVAQESSLPLQILLTGAAANLPFSLAAVILTVALSQIFKKESQVCILWALIIYLIPTAIQILGLKIPLCAQIAGWLPWNFLQTEVNATFSSRQMDALWMYPEGFLKLMIVGAVGIILFGAAGIAGFRKKDIS